MIGMVPYFYLLFRGMGELVATPGRALAECLALRRTVVPNVRIEQIISANVGRLVRVIV